MNPTGHVVVGHMRCAGCRYALRGQPVVHLDEYGLLAVRCPECGRVAPAGEALLLGPWAGRLTAGAFVAWVLVIAAAWMGFNGNFYLFSRIAAETGSTRYQEFLEERFRAALDPKAARQVAGMPMSVPVSMFTGNFTTWWGKQDPAALLAEAGGRVAIRDWRALFFWVPLALHGMLAGMMAAVALDRLSRRSLLLRLPLIVAPLIAFVAVELTGWDERPVRWASEAAYLQTARPVLIASTVAAAVFVAAGLLVGRPVTRMVLRRTAPRLAAGVIARLGGTPAPAPP